MRSVAVRPAIDIQYDRPGIPQTVNECRQDQYAGKVYANAPEKEYSSIQYQKPDMRNRIGVIGPKFFAHRDDHRTAEQTDHALNDHETSIRYPKFAEIPRLKKSKEDIGFA